LSEFLIFILLFKGVPMNIRLFFAVFISKLIIKLCRLLKRGGTTLAGKAAFKIYPDILKHLSSNFQIIMVTGTNGKTTTSRIVAQVLKENNIDFITNKSGANLLSGITTMFIEHVNLAGRCSSKTALIEIDEAAFKVAANYIKPDILIVTNFFRDQLDRYGELYSTLKGVREGIEKSPKTKLILNADDSLCASLGRETNNEVIYFGIDDKAYNGSEESANSDAMFCIYCKTRYDYSSHVYGHLGSFRCPNCGYSRPKPHVVCTSVDELTDSHSVIHFSASDINGYGENLSEKNTFEAKINLPGLYNVYNALAAAACSVALNLPMANTVKALGEFECGFGRMETIQTDNKTIKMILVKNPTGFNQVLNFLVTQAGTDCSLQQPNREETGFKMQDDLHIPSGKIHVAFAINDKLADGTDVSWLWDVDFEKLSAVQDKLANVFTSGIRGEDMAVRLKYAGIELPKIRLIKDYDLLINTALSSMHESESLYILPTYTAMLDIRKLLKKKFKLKNFWQ